MSVLFYILAGFTLLTSALSISERVDWWIKAWDAMRQQLAFLTFCLGIASLFLPEVHLIFSILLFAACAFHLSVIYKFTPLHSVEVLSAKEEIYPIKFYTANVRQKNSDYKRLLKSIRQEKPDVILLTEPNGEWLENIDAPLRETHPYTVTEPLENTLGMALYSKYPFLKSAVKYLVEDDVPSIHVVLKVGMRLIQFIGLHPRPPAPWTEDDRNKDREMVAAGQLTNWDQYPTVVSGDLNDVGWSRITNDFKKISGLRDPRIGRGFFNTYNVFIPLFRMPIDHFFISEDFKLLNMKRLPAIGSDHFPVTITLNLEFFDFGNLK